MENKNCILSKKEFLNIIERIEGIVLTTVLIERAMLTSGSAILRDSKDASNLLLAEHEIVLELLGKIMKDEYKFIELFVYDLDFGRSNASNVLDENGKLIDITSAEKLYDYLLERM